MAATLPFDEYAFGFSWVIDEPLQLEVPDAVPGSPFEATAGLERADATSRRDLPRVLLAMPSAMRRR